MVFAVGLTAQYMRSVVSIHDLMPDTLKRVVGISQKLRHLGVPADKVYLLVVPGLPWKPAQIETLKALQADGFLLAGHGWYHHIHKKTSLKHYLHSLFISRNVAEHLSLTRAEISDMIEMNYEWFLEQGFKAPDLYVPPAWAMGNISREHLQQRPFRYYEYSSGVLDSHTNVYRALPLTGYEADRLWRVPVLSAWNRFNTQFLAKTTPLRISIHPYDFDYRLNRSIEQDIENTSRFLDCTELFA